MNNKKALQYVSMTVFKHRGGRPRTPLIDLIRSLKIHQRFIKVFVVIEIMLPLFFSNSVRLTTKGFGNKQLNTNQLERITYKPAESCYLFLPVIVYWKPTCSFSISDHLYKSICKHTVLRNSGQPMVTEKTMIISISISIL